MAVAKEVMEGVRLSDVTQVISPNKMLCIFENNHVGEALGALKNHQCMAAPIIDKEGDPYGSIDTLDLVAYTVLKLDPKTSGANFNLQRVNEYLEKQPIRNLIDISTRNKFISLNKDSPLRSAVRYLSNPHIHRVFLKDQEGKPCGVLTQFKLLKYLYGSKNKFTGSYFQRKVGEKFPGGKDVVSVREDEDVLSAFRKIREEGITGVAVVNKEGVLTGNISATDIRDVHATDPGEMIFRMSQSVAEHIKKQPVVVQLDDTVENVVEKMIENQVHRIYVVDDHNKPVRVISIGDVLQGFQY